ncbi:addiction module antitoxin RelB [Staphylococcus sp. HMSC036D05]|uniref:Txe/YoeB family addiction module toxin n=1 Tax=Staphylococcus sp. HMSC036D05 TaxID=1715059 RepID=UPI0008A88135|nr:Txe/YoeB family addiction module toxin [Staphylococcus sp. HMSC036D05]OHO68925.1 addiction module antitoxin RelB [Staphylococcus sp. HMSC036D05]
MNKLNVTFTTRAFKDYQFWKQHNLGNFKKINTLLKSIARDGCIEGIGKPEALKGNYEGYYSRRITIEHRLVYKIKNDSIFIVSCRFHYL